MILYRKYRPQRFSEIIGQKYIVKTLTGAIAQGQIGHAYLFTGPRGTGKTSLARIFAKAINCTENTKTRKHENTKTQTKNKQNSNITIHEETQSTKKPSQPRNPVPPCLQCEICKTIANNQCLDIIEIDAASNTGVDNIRELRETVKLPPHQARYKVYIIDEVHMLSTGAFNALLKTLEEPPQHVVFILATTEIHKIPETILSRCQRFDFTRLPIADIILKLEKIAKQEKIKIDKNSLEMIALSAEGGMRDAESLLSQIMAMEDKEITEKEVEEILGTANRSMIEETANSMLSNNLTTTLQQINKLSQDGYDLEIFVKSLLNYLRQVLLISLDENLSQSFSYELTSDQMKKMKEITKNTNSSKIIFLIENLLKAQGEIKSSFLPQLPLEIAIVKSISNQVQNQNELQNQNTNINKSSTQLNQNISQPPPKADPPLAEINQKTSLTSQTSITSTLDKVKNNWPNIIQEIKKQHHSLSALIANCEPVNLVENKLSLSVKYSFYKDQLNNNQNRLTIEEILAKILGESLIIEGIYDEPRKIASLTRGDTRKIASLTRGDTRKVATLPRGTTDNNPVVQEALNLFGGKVVS